MSTRKDKDFPVTTNRKYWTVWASRGKLRARACSLMLTLNLWRGSHWPSLQLFPQMKACYLLFTKSEKIWFGGFLLEEIKQKCATLIENILEHYFVSFTSFQIQSAGKIGWVHWSRPRQSFNNHFQFIKICSEGSDLTESCSVPQSIVTLLE